jgi:hypothetical protein
LRVLSSVILRQLGSISGSDKRRVILLERLFEVVDLRFEVLDALFTVVIYVKNLLVFEE